MHSPQAPLIELSGITKAFGAVRALAGVDLAVRSGEVLGIVGHNGAGKSTLMGVMRGTVPPTGGGIRVDGCTVTSGYSVRRAYQLGIRCVFQEPSLCPTLRVFENTRLMHPSLGGFGWAHRARSLIGRSLDTIFPGHRIRADAVIADLSSAERQMVEIARAFTVVTAPVRLVILDEPTSSLDARIASQFLGHVRRCPERGQACILISHRLKEIISTTDRVTVMRDGAVVGGRPSVELSEGLLVDLMGAMARPQGGSPDREMISPVASPGSVSHVERVAMDTTRKGPRMVAHAGEVVGFAGLDGHGQRHTLLQVFKAAHASSGTGAVNGSIAYVSGDRQREGIFALWSVAENLTVGVLRRLARAGFVRAGAERRLAAEWRERLGIRTPDVTHPITSLSGGNQQKVLIARALCGGADIVLLDDPMRGVDVGSKREMYEQIRHQAARGTCVLLYTTEFEELAYCDRVYVFYRHGITAELARDELTEERVLRASFADAEPDHQEASAALATTA